MGMKIALGGLDGPKLDTFWARSEWVEVSSATDDGGVLTAVSTFCISIYFNFDHEQPTSSYPSEFSHESE